MEVDEKESGCKLGHFVKWVPVRRRFAVDSAFFAAGNVERELLAKQVSLSSSVQNLKLDHYGKLTSYALSIHLPSICSFNLGDVYLS